MERNNIINGVFEGTVHAAQRVGTAVMYIVDNRRYFEKLEREWMDVKGYEEGLTIHLEKISTNTEKQSSQLTNQDELIDSSDKNPNSPSKERIKAGYL